MKQRATLDDRADGHQHSHGKRRVRAASSGCHIYQGTHLRLKPLASGNYPESEIFDNQLLQLEFHKPTTTD